MGVLRIACLLVAVACAAGGQKKPIKPPDVEVVRILAQRESRQLVLDGTFRNNSGRLMKGLVIYFEFLESGGQMISRKLTKVTDEELAPGDEAQIQVQTPDPVRAVWYRLEAEDGTGRNLVIDKPGPYTIE